MVYARETDGRPSQHGFTLIELIIVIVVIAILAVISTALYFGLQERARNSAAKSAIVDVTKKMLNYSTLNNGQYPPTLASAGIYDSESTKYTYTLLTDIQPNYYCLTATVDEQSAYFLTSKTTTPAAGSCFKLEAWWPFNDNDEDYSFHGRVPNSNSGTLTTGESGFSGAIEFGSGNGFVVPSVDGGVLQDVSFDAYWTIAAWMKSTGDYDDEAIIVGRVGCNGGLYTNDGKYQFAIKTSNGNCWDGSANLDGVPVDDEWHFLVGLYEAGKMTFYVDGEVKSTGFIDKIYGYGTTLRVGGSGSRTFTGKVDDVRILSRAMTPQEIRQLYGAGAY